MSHNMFPPFDATLPFSGQVDDLMARVVNLPVDVPDPAPARTVTRVAKALHEKLLAQADDVPMAILDQEDCQTIASAVPENELSKLIGGIDNALQEKVAGDSALTMFNTRAFLPALIPLLQPRTADAPSNLKLPRVYGRISASGDVRAALYLEFDDEEHFRAHIMEAVRHTLSEGTDLRTSIVQHGVSEPVLGVVATVTFADTGAEFNALIVRDGLTRTVNCFRVAYGDSVTRAQLPSKIADLALRTVGPTGGDGLTKALRKGRDQTQHELNGKFRAAAGDTEDPDLTRIGQTQTLPVKIIAGMRRFTEFPSDDAKPMVFPDAVQSMIAQTHMLSKTWTKTAISANSAVQAVQRLASAELIDPAVADVAMSLKEFTFDVADADGNYLLRTYGDDEETSVDVELHRAVWLLSQFSDPDVYRAAKAELRALHSLTSIHKRVFAGLMQSLFTRPWAIFKQESFSNAQRAWTAGGPLPHDLYDSSWTALLPSTYAELVEPASNPDAPDHDNALATLQAAGGVALVTDGILLAPSGSTEVGSQGARFARTAPNRIVEKLSATIEGLWVLAHAADSFQAQKPAVNSYAPNVLPTKIPDNAYKIEFPTDGNPSTARKVARRDPLFDLVRTVAGLKDSGKPLPPNPNPNPSSPEEEAQGLTTNARGFVADLIRELTQLRALSTTKVPDPYAATAQQEVWKDTREDLLEALQILGALKPTQDDDVIPDEGEDDEFDSDDFDSDEA